LLIPPQHQEQPNPTSCWGTRRGGTCSSTPWQDLGAVRRGAYTGEGPPNTSCPLILGRGKAHPDNPPPGTNLNATSSSTPTAALGHGCTLPQNTEVT